MKWILYLSLPVTLIVGIWIGSILGYSCAEEDYAYERLEQLYKDSAVEVKIYKKAIQLIEEEKNNEAIVFIKNLLEGSRVILETNKSIVSEELRNKVEEELLKDIVNISNKGEYEKHFPL